MGHIVFEGLRGKPVAFPSAAMVDACGVSIKSILQHMQGDGHVSDGDGSDDDDEEDS
jgi:hypothetical protein